MLHVICALLRPGHLSVRVGDSSRRNEEIGKISNCAFQCDHYYHYHQKSLEHSVDVYNMNHITATPRHWDRRGQHPPAGQSSSSHNLWTEKWTLSTPLPPSQTEKFPFRRMSMRHGSSNLQPHPAVLPHCRRFETPDMAQSGGGPQEALGAG